MGSEGQGVWGEERRWGWGVRGGGVAWGRGAGQAWGCCSAFLNHFSGWGAPLFAAVGVLAMSSSTFAAPCIYIYMYPNISIYGLVGKKAGRNVTVSE